jgi:MFS family permease
MARIATFAPAGPATEISEPIQGRAMSRAQIVAVVLCAVINMIDGFDILASAFTAPDIARTWSVKAAALGLLFSSSLAGMTVGALVLSPIADHWGRRRVVLAALGVITIGMLLSAVAPSLDLLMASRALTGAGVGAMMPTINTVVAEVANRRRRDFCVTLQSAGFPLGGAVGSLGIYLLPDAGWRSVFAAGGAFSLVLAPAALMWMPESLEFLVGRRRGDLPRLNLWLTRFRLPPVHELPPPAASRVTRSQAWRALGWDPALMCASFFLLMFTFYFLTSWTPKLLTDYGLSRQVGVSGAALMNGGGVIGDLMFAGLVLRWPAFRVGPVFMGLTFLSACGFALVPLRLEVLLPLALVMGLLLFGSMASLYALAPSVYPAAARTTGTGAALGLGRIGATVGPYAGGLLIAQGWDRLSYLTAMAAPVALCMFLVMALGRREPRRTPAVSERCAGCNA